MLRIDIEKTDELEVVKSRLYLVDCGSDRLRTLEEDDDSSPRRRGPQTRASKNVDIDEVDALDAWSQLLGRAASGRTFHGGRTLTRLLQDSLGGIREPHGGVLGPNRSVNGRVDLIRGPGPTRPRASRIRRRTVIDATLGGQKMKGEIRASGFYERVARDRRAS